MLRIQSTIKLPIFPYLLNVLRFRTVRGVMVNPKIKKNESRRNENCDVRTSSVHSFSEEETKGLRRHLLSWYDENKRDLPWRTQHSEQDDKNLRAYAVWVSEIMLQQTQVATVIDYYTKWMKKWPSVEALSKATLEEVNEAWSGLGYYSRGRRLHEGAQKVVNEMNGQIPRCAADLLKELPGVGRYTAGAIASIALGEVTGLVDGNVVRVFSRMRIIGGESSSQPVTDALWSIANSVVDEERPGDFNQALMELGATVCSPKTPSCENCPVNTLCNAYQQTISQKKSNEGKLLSRNGSADTQLNGLDCDIEDCQLCLQEKEPWDSALGVMNYPRKAKKKPPREERTLVGIVSRTNDNEEAEYLISQRPEKGLLANLWEFPSVLMEEDLSEVKKQNQLSDTLQKCGCDVGDSKKQFVGEVVHIFSHIHQTYVLYSVKDTGPHETPVHKKLKWVTRQEFLDSAVSTAMKKVFKLFESKCNNSRQDSSKKSGTKRKRDGSGNSSNDGRKQMALDSFFKPKGK